MSQYDDGRTQVGDSIESGLDQSANAVNSAVDIAKSFKDHKNEAEKSEPQAKKDSESKSEKVPEKNNGKKSSTKTAHDSPGATKTGGNIGDFTGGGTAAGEGAAAGEGVGTAAASGTGTAVGSGTGAAAGAGATAGSAAGAAAGAGTAAGAGATAGSAAGPVGTAVGAAVGLASSLLGKALKIIVFIVIIFMLITSAIIEQLVPNIITKPVATTIATIKGVYEKAKSLISGFIDFFSGGEDEDERKTIETLEEATQYCVEIIDEILESAYEDATADIKKLCDEKGYDYQTTIDTFTTQQSIFNSTNYAFIIATYSVTTDFTNVTVKNFKEQLRKHLDITYTISETSGIKEQWDPVPIYRYDPVVVSICVDEIEHGGDEEEESWTEHVYESYTVYEKSTEVDKREDGTGYWISNIEGEMVTNYVSASRIPNSGHNESALDGRYVWGSVVGDSAEILVMPEKKEVTYADITLTPYQNDEVFEMFDINPEDKYRKDGYDTTYRQVIEMRMKMMEGLVNTILTTAHVEYATNGLTEAEIEAYMASLPADVSGNRKQVIKTALSLVGMVPYYYGGKPNNTGWNDNWWTDTSPDHKGRTKDGLDCSGYVQWVFATAGFNGGGLDGSLVSTSSISNLQYITKNELKPGDIGLKYQGDSKHTGIYMGNDTWIHCSSSGTVVVAPGYSGFPLYKRYKPLEMESDNYYKEGVEVYSKATDFDYTGDKWYLMSQVIYQECSASTEGTIAVAECIRNRCLDNGFPNDPYAVITQSGQFEAYGAGHYKKRTPTADQIELVKQVIGGTKSIMYNQRVLFFVSTSYHKSHFLTGKSWLVKAGYKVFGTYGDNVYYIK